MYYLRKGRSGFKEYVNLPLCTLSAMLSLDTEQTTWFIHSLLMPSTLVPLLCKCWLVYDPFLTILTLPDRLVSITIVLTVCYGLGLKAQKTDQFVSSSSSLRRVCCLPVSSNCLASVSVSSQALACHFSDDLRPSVYANSFLGTCVPEFEIFQRLLKVDVPKQVECPPNTKE